MNECAKGKLSFGEGVQIQQLADVHRIAEDAFGVLEGLQVLVHKQVQLLLNIAYILAEIDILLQQRLAAIGMNEVFALFFGIIERLVGMVYKL
ncbi:hypothetical protein D3C86_1779110 [compost metagenome]